MALLDVKKKKSGSGLKRKCLTSTFSTPPPDPRIPIVSSRVPRQASNPPRASPATPSLVCSTVPTVPPDHLGHRTRSQRTPRLRVLATSSVHQLKNRCGSTSYLYRGLGAVAVCFFLHIF